MKLSIVATLYQSAPYLSEFLERANKVAVNLFADDYEIILVNDGSTDDSLGLAVQLMQEYSCLNVIDLSRNFGHHKAIMTGLSFAQGDYVFLIDSDLEEAPELLILYWNELITSSFDVVYGVQSSRKGGWFERFSGKIFYNLLNKLSSLNYPANTLTARLMTKRYVQSVLRFKETELDIWVIFILTGFSQKAIISEKLYKGSSTYNFERKLSVAIDSITTLSSRPPYFTFILGFAFLVLSLLGGVYIVLKKYLDDTLEGWASIMVLILFIGGLILFVLGILGVYLSKMYLELKGRPLTVVRQIYRSKHD